MASQRIDKQAFERIEDKSVFTVAGEDALNNIKLEANGQLDAGDVRCMYYQALHHKQTIYPRVSLVQNIGHDVGGVHSGSTIKFQHEGLWDKVDDFHFLADLQPDPQIMKANKKFRKPSLTMRASVAIHGTALHAFLKRTKQLLGNRGW